MKRTLCLLLGLFAGSATAMPARSFIELQFGEMKHEYPVVGGDEGDMLGFTAAWASSPTLYWRADHRRIEHELTLDPYAVGDEIRPGLLVTDTTDIDVDAWDHLQEYEISSVTVGVRSPMNQGVDLIGEIGAARIRNTISVLNVFANPAQTEVLSISRGLVEHEATGALGRLGLVVEDGAVGWGGSMDWYRKVPAEFTGETDSMRWWNAYVGWRITENWMLSVAYHDYDEYTTRAVALRWTL